MENKQIIYFKEKKKPNWNDRFEGYGPELFKILLKLSPEHREL